MGIVYRGRARVRYRARVEALEGHARPSTGRTDGYSSRRFHDRGSLWRPSCTHTPNIVPACSTTASRTGCYNAMQCIVGVRLERVLEDVRRLQAAANPDPGAETGRGTEEQ